MEGDCATPPLVCRQRTAPIGHWGGPSFAHHACMEGDCDLRGRVLQHCTSRPDEGRLRPMMTARDVIRVTHHARMERATAPGFEFADALSRASPHNRRVQDRIKPCGYGIERLLLSGPTHPGKAASGSLAPDSCCGCRMPAGEGLGQRRTQTKATANFNRTV